MDISSHLDTYRQSNFWLTVKKWLKDYYTCMRETPDYYNFALYYGLFMYNKNAMEQLERLDLAFEALKKELFGICMMF
ncbi:putative arogenate dehydrogenase (NADP(+)) [Helianthus annuus]|nr:putative arogenate dehydrogenase (NADP(+)) [Helianthus annuus]